jgi:ankyrin repeat protein
LVFYLNLSKENPTIVSEVVLEVESGGASESKSDETSTEETSEETDKETVEIQIVNYQLDIFEFLKDNPDAIDVINSKKQNLLSVLLSNYPFELKKRIEAIRYFNDQLIEMGFHDFNGASRGDFSDSYENNTGTNFWFKIMNIDKYIAMQMVKHNRDLTVIGQNTLSYLIMASMNRCYEHGYNIIDELIGKDCKPDHIARSGFSTLAHLIKDYTPQEFIIKFINTYKERSLPTTVLTNNDGSFTALTLAIERRSHNVIELLINEYPESVQFKNSNGKTIPILIVEMLSKTPEKITQYLNTILDRFDDYPCDLGSVWDYNGNKQTLMIMLVENKYNKLALRLLELFKNEYLGDEIEGREMRFDLNLHFQKPFFTTSTEKPFFENVLFIALKMKNLTIVEELLLNINSYNVDPSDFLVSKVNDFYKTAFTEIIHIINAFNHSTTTKISDITQYWFDLLIDLYENRLHYPKIRLAGNKTIISLLMSLINSYNKLSNTSEIITKIETMILSIIESTPEIDYTITSVYCSNDFHAAMDSGYKEIAKAIFNKCPRLELIPPHLSINIFNDMARYWSEWDDFCEEMYRLKPDFVSHKPNIVLRTTPLITACRYGNSKMAIKLLELGSPTLVYDKDGYDAMYYADFKNLTDVVIHIMKLNPSAYKIVRR